MSNYLYIAQYVDRFGGSCPSHKKIGIGENVPARMRSLSDTKGTIDVMSLAVWKTKDDTSIQKIELMLHQRFADRRLNGEWFSDDKDDLLPLIEDLVATIETIKKMELSEIPGALPSPIGTQKGHFDFVSSPKGRRRDTNKEAIIGQLQKAYTHLVSRLPRDYVALNDNGPYIRANANGTPFWIEPRASGIKLNFWVGDNTPLYETMQQLLILEYDGKANTNIGTGKHQDQHQFALYNLSITDLDQVIDALLLSD